jgi:hypothetical protein
MKKVLVFLFLLIPSICFANNGVTSTVTSMATSVVTSRFTTDLSSHWSMQPSVAVFLLQIGLKDGEIDGGVQTVGAGYGFTYKKNTFKINFSTYLSANLTDPKTIQPTLVISVMEYYRLGFSALIKEHYEWEPLLLLGSGIDF